MVNTEAEYVIAKTDSKDPNAMYQKKTVYQLIVADMVDALKACAIAVGGGRENRVMKVNQTRIPLSPIPNIFRTYEILTPHPFGHLSYLEAHEKKFMLTKMFGTYFMYNLFTTLWY